MTAMSVVRWSMTPPGGDIVDRRGPLGNAAAATMIARMKKPAKAAKLVLPGPLLRVGAGKMGQAMLDGWLARGLNPRKVVVVEPQPAKPIKALTKRGARINPKTPSEAA